MDYIGAWATQKDGSHYKGQKIQTMHFAMANELNALEFCIVKYTCRKKKEERILDIGKAKHCADMLEAWEKGKITADQITYKMEKLDITVEGE